MVQKTPHDLDSSHINFKVGVISKIKRSRQMLNGGMKNINLVVFS
jgi:hypothetical protein